MGLVTLTSPASATVDTGRRWHKGGYTYGLFRWKHSGTPELCCTNLDMVINERARRKGGAKIRDDWSSCRNDEIYAELAAEGITIGRPDPGWVERYQ